MQGGGKYPYEWSVDGEGFQFQNGAKSIETKPVSGNQVRLSALPIACGVAIITCSDGCSSVVGKIRSTSGAWVRRYDLDNTCVIGVMDGPDPGIADEYEGVFTSTVTDGEYRVEQRWRQAYVEVSNGVDTCEALRSMAMAQLPAAIVYKSDFECVKIPGITAIPGYSKVYEKAGYCTTDGSIRKYRVVINYPSHSPIDGVAVAVWRWQC